MVSFLLESSLNFLHILLFNKQKIKEIQLLYIYTINCTMKKNAVFEVLLRHIS